MPSDADVFDPVPLLEALASANVDFVLIGGVAGGSYGSAFGTFDVDVAYSRDRENLARLAGVLQGLGATLRNAPDGLPFQLDEKTIENGANFTFNTRLGALDILAEPAGAPTYRELKARGTSIVVGGRTIIVASLDHLIAMKEAAGRPKDKLMATEYRVLSDELRAPRASAGSRAITFGARLEGFPGVSREIAVRSDQTLVDLHGALQDAFAWDDDHLYAFWLDGAFWGSAESEYAVPFELEPGQKSAEVALAELGLGAGATIAYLFDFGDEWRVLLTALAIGPVDDQPYPRIVASKGDAPPQYDEPDD